MQTYRRLYVGSSSGCHDSQKCIRRFSSVSRRWWFSDELGKSKFVSVNDIWWSRSLSLLKICWSQWNCIFTSRLKLWFDVEMPNFRRDRAGVQLKTYWFSAYLDNTGRSGFGRSLGWSSAWFLGHWCINSISVCSTIMIDARKYGWRPKDISHIEGSGRASDGLFRSVRPTICW